MHRDRIVGQRSSGILFLFWLGLVIYGTIKLRTLSLLSIDNVRGLYNYFRLPTSQCTTNCVMYVCNYTYLHVFIAPYPLHERYIICTIMLS